MAKIGTLGIVAADLDSIADGITYKRVTQTEKNTWNAKSDFSGDYDDLINKRGVTVYVSATEPEDPELNDIWIKI
jgi:hypothetical protein